LNILDAAVSVIGFLDPLETRLLYDLASQVPAGGVIVEIGSYQGRSTVILGLGAKAAGAFVWALDPHEEHSVDAFSHYGMKDNAALMENLTLFGLGETVRIVALKSEQVVYGWHCMIDLLWIDGGHDYDSVKRDFEEWSKYVSDGKIAMHDTSGHYPDVSRFVDELLAAGEWERIALQDATSVFQRVTI
jgi:predicted O-methyltransferase YrrM